MWCCRRMEKISWTNHVRNAEVLHRVKEERNIVHTVNRRKFNWIGQSCIISAFQNMLLKER